MSITDFSVECQLTCVSVAPDLGKFGNPPSFVFSCDRLSTHIRNLNQIKTVIAATMLQNKRTFVHFLVIPVFFGE